MASRTVSYNQINPNGYESTTLAHEQAHTQPTSVFPGKNGQTNLNMMMKSSPSISDFGAQTHPSRNQSSNDLYQNNQYGSHSQQHLRQSQPNLQIPLQSQPSLNQWNASASPPSHSQHNQQQHLFGNSSHVPPTSTPHVTSQQPLQPPVSTPLRNHSQHILNQSCNSLPLNSAPAPHFRRSQSFYHAPPADHHVIPSQDLYRSASQQFDPAQPPPIGTSADPRLGSRPPLTKLNSAPAMSMQPNNQHYTYQNQMPHSASTHSLYNGHPLNLNQHQQNDMQIPPFQPGSQQPGLSYSHSQQFHQPPMKSAYTNPNIILPNAAPSFNIQMSPGTGTAYQPQSNMSGSQSYGNGFNHPLYNSSDTFKSSPSGYWEWTVEKSKEAYNGVSSMLSGPAKRNTFDSDATEGGWRSWLGRNKNQSSVNRYA